MKKHDSETQWISLSDMMTSLMMVFLLVSILFMYQLQKKQNEQQQLFVEYKQGKDQIYEDLYDTFKDKIKDWQIIIDRDLTIKFTNPEVLFDYQSSALSPKYTEILTEFIPQYIEIINKPEYKDKIAEVRIEGHTAGWDDYMYTINLSQQRANSVLNFILNSDSYKKLSEPDQAKLRFWVTANGLGFGRALDKDGAYTYTTNNIISSISRRVEFRIVTTSESLVNKVLNNLNK